MISETVVVANPSSAWRLQKERKELVASLPRQITPQSCGPLFRHHKRVFRTTTVKRAKAKKYDGFSKQNFYSRRGNGSRRDNSVIWCPN